MSFQDLIQHMLDDTLGTSSQLASLWAFRPELVVCGTIVAVLLTRMIAPRAKSGPFYVALIGAALALMLAIPWQAIAGNGPMKPAEIFTGMLVFDTFSIYMRCLLLFFLLAFTAFTQASGVPDADDATEFYVLVFGAILGMCLMVSANHMLIVFLGIEMASVPSYVLAGLLRHRRLSSEAALKYAIFGAGTAGVMLYGISLLVGTLGSAHLPTMTVRLAEMILAGQAGNHTLVLVLGGLMLMVGLAFKLSAVPFHFWAPDVFEGASAEVAAFLSVASKAAALALLVRLAIGFGHVDPAMEAASGPQLPHQQNENVARAGLAGGMTTDTQPSNSDILPHRNTPSPPAPLPQAGEGSYGHTSPKIASPSEVASFRAFSVASDLAQPAAASPTAASPEQPPELRRSLSDALQPVRRYIAGLIGLIAAMTCTFGNLAAYGQTNIKRLLAYSTIAHAGYMMMPVAAAVALLGEHPAGAQEAVAALAFYVAIYLFMNLGAFAVVAFMRNALHSELIADYAGLVRRSPGVAVCMSVIMFSLLGLPPLAGFSAKFAVFASLVDAGLITLLVIGGLNTVLSLFYYLRVVRIMTLDPEPAGRPAPLIPMASVPGVYCAALTLPLIVLFLLWGGLFAWAKEAASFVLF